MCDLLNISSHWWSLTGLTTDFVGVVLLGSDVIRIQVALRRATAANGARYKKFEDEYGGITNWLKELTDSARRWHRVDLEGPIADDDMTHNAHRTRGELSEVANAAGALGEYVGGLADMLKERVHEDEKLATTSLKFSFVGMSLILIGFGLQILGGWVC